MSIPRNRCPHCDSKLKIRSSNREHPLIKSIYGQCQNLECGATYKGIQEWTVQLSPSALPHSNIAKQLTQIDIQFTDITP